MDGFSSNEQRERTTASHGGRTFEVVIVQHPLRARMCGFGEKDRRPIDPPPAVQLRVYNSQGQAVSLTEAETSAMVMSASLWSHDTTKECNVVIDPSSIPTQNPTNYNNSVAVLSLKDPRKMKNLIGTTVSSSFYLLDHNQDTGIFFIFNDLSVRTEGRFTLKFSFINLESSQYNHSSTRVIAEVTSSVFEVYSAKRFPGMTSSTELSKAFSEQGIRIPIRSKPRVRNKNQFLAEQSGDREHDDED